MNDIEQLAQLDRILVMQRELINRHKNVCASRDELLAALKKCAEQLEIILPVHGKVHDERQALISAKVAIAKAESA